MVDVIYLKKGERRPRGRRSFLIECKPGLQGQIVSDGPEGVTWTVNTNDLERALKDMKSMGVAEIYVRKLARA